MKIICSWCGWDMGEKEPLNNNSITHTICKRCEETNFLDMKLNWQCNYCPETFPNFKLLLEHYESKHKQDLKRFQIRHIKTKASGIVSAINSEEACEFFGWNSQDCKIKVIE